jgi:hypothetical protein
MRLREHPGFPDGWPAQPGGSFSGSHAVPLHGGDLLVQVFLQRIVGSDLPRVVLMTLYQGAEHTHEFRIGDKEFAEGLVRFLTLNAGRTIDEIGELEVDF